MFKLTEENFVMFAIKNYDNATCLGVKDFNNDLKRFKYIKRLFRRYAKTKKIRDHLVLNHFIVLHNLFGTSMVPMMFFKIEKKFWPQVKTFLVFLNLLPENYRLSNGVPASTIPLDSKLIDKLRKV